MSSEVELMAQATLVIMDSLNLALRSLELANKMMPYSDLKDTETLQIGLLEGIQNLKAYIGDLKRE